jgi:hypothetical protein
VDPCPSLGVGHLHRRARVHFAASVVVADPSFPFVEIACSAAASAGPKGTFCAIGTLLGNVKAFGTANRRHYALTQKKVSPNDRARWARDLNIQVIPYDDHGDLPSILRALAQTRQTPP